MSGVSSTAATIGPASYRREIDPAEAALVGRYAADLGYCIYAWNRAISASFHIYLGLYQEGDGDPLKTWEGWSDADKSKALRKRAASLPDNILTTDIEYVVDSLDAYRPARNAIVHLGLNYVPGGVAADPYGKPDRVTLVQQFLDEPGSLSALIGDLRELAQYAGEVGFRASFPSADDPVNRMPRPTRLLDPAVLALAAKR